MFLCLVWCDDYAICGFHLNLLARFHSILGRFSIGSKLGLLLYIRIFSCVMSVESYKDPCLIISAFGEAALLLALLLCYACGFAGIIHFMSSPTISRDKNDPGYDAGKLYVVIFLLIYRPHPSPLLPPTPAPNDW